MMPIMSMIPSAAPVPPYMSRDARARRHGQRTSHIFEDVGYIWGLYQPYVSHVIAVHRTGASIRGRPLPFSGPSSPLGGGGRDAHCCPAAALVLGRAGVGETVRAAALRECAGLPGCPAVTGQARSAR